MPMDRGSVMLPYLPAFCNSYLHPSGDAGTVSWRPPRPRRCPRASCGLNLPACETHDHGASCPQSLRPLWREPPAWQQAPTRWCALGAGQPGTPSCWPPPLVGALGCHRTPLRETRGYGCGEAPLYLGRNLVPWGQPLYLGEKTLVPWGEIPLYLLATWPCTPGKSLVP